MDPFKDDDGPEQGEAPDVVAMIQILGVTERGLERVQAGEPGGLVVVRCDGGVRRHYLLMLFEDEGRCGIREVGGLFLKSILCVCSGNVICS